MRFIGNTGAKTDSKGRVFLPPVSAVFFSKEDATRSCCARMSIRIVL